MGEDPRTSVVNHDCQFHDVEIVYVIDAWWLEACHWS